MPLLELRDFITEVYVSSSMDEIALLLQLLFTYLSNQLKHKNMPWEKNFNKFGFPAGFNNFDAQRFSSTYYMFFLKKLLT